MPSNPEIIIPQLETVPQVLTKVPYNYHNGPSTPLERALREGANCQWFVHAYHDIMRGTPLPPWALSAEIFDNKSGVFSPITPSQNLVGGDLFLFGKSSTLPTNLHLAVYIGTDNVGNDNYKPLLAHLSYEVGGLAIWTLTTFFTLSRYAELRGVRRYVPFADIPSLNEL